MWNCVNQEMTQSINMPVYYFKFILEYTLNKLLLLSTPSFEVVGSFQVTHCGQRSGLLVKAHFERYIILKQTVQFKDFWVSLKERSLKLKWKFDLHENSSNWSTNLGSEIARFHCVLPFLQRLTRR